MHFFGYEVMSWSGYLTWLKNLKNKVKLAWEKKDYWEVQRCCETALLSIVRVWDFAKKINSERDIQEYEKYFKEMLSKIPQDEDSVMSMFFEQTTSNNLSSIQNKTDSISNKKLINEYIQKGDYKRALEALKSLFNAGHRDYETIRLIIFCFEKIGNAEELWDFLSNALIYKDSFGKKELSFIYYKLGCTLLQLNKTTQAREFFWKLKKIDPDFPGLKERLEELERKKGRSRSRYEVLIKENILTQEQLEEAKELSKREKEDLDEVLIKRYNIPKKQLLQSLSSFYDVPFVEFDPNVDPPFELFEKRKLDPNFLKQYGWVPFRKKGNSVEVLMTNPFDLSKLDEIKFILGTNNIVPLVAIKSDIDSYIDHFFKELSAESELISFDEEIEAEGPEESFDDLESEISEQDSEIVRLVNAILVEAWRRGASDIHIEPNTILKYLSIRMRIDGTCHEFKKLKLHYARPLVSRIKIMAKLDIAERRLPQDGKIKIRLPNLNKIVEYRVATLPTIDNQEDVVLRVLASGKPIPLDKLGLLPRNLELFKDQITQPYGLILVVGPTGSGKTTTLHSALGYINTPDKKIWTAEDPVEITQSGLRQVQINPKIGLTFSSALRAFLRADPDVIMIGEMRDRETAHIGIEASLTGHLVFSTLHTNSAPETITRLLDMDLDPFNFADSLLCILAQRLIKTLCNNCKEPYEPMDEEIEELKYEFGEDDWDKWVNEDEITLYRAKGCSQCVNGYRGRMGIHELLNNSDEIKILIKKRAPTEDIRKVAIQEGMLTLKQDGIMKVLMGHTDIHQVRAVAGKK